YALLAQAATEAGSDMVLVAHTAEDQAETVAMRLARGDGPGAAGMAAMSLYDQRIWLLRPILNLRRADLRHYLDQRALRYIDDPSNDNMHYERVRVRKAMSESELQKLLEKARLAAAQREACGEAVAGLV